MAAIIEREPEPLAVLDPMLPGAIPAIVNRCLRKRPEERYESTETLVRALKGAATSVSKGVALVPTPRQEPSPPPAEVLPVVPADIEDPRDLRRRRMVEGFGWHLTSFVFTLFVFELLESVFVTMQIPKFWGLPFFMWFWGFWVIAHGVWSAPSAVGLLREHRRRRQPPPRIEAPPRPPAERLAASPVSTAVGLPPSFLAEVARVRALLERRDEQTRPQQIDEIDGIVRQVNDLAARARDLEEQTSASETAELEQTQREIEAKLEDAQLAQNRQLLDRQRQVIRSRLETIRKGQLAAERLRIRIDLAEHQIKQLRLDLSRSEASSLAAPELSSRLQFIRHEVDAREEVDEMFED